MSKVLLINDSNFERIIIKDILSSMGHDVKIADENNAINLIKTYCPDFLIANYIMKELRGDQLIALVKMANPNIRCILSSSNDVSEKDFRNRSIDAVIHTPVSKARMVEVFSKLESKVSYSIQKQEAAQEEAVTLKEENIDDFDIVKFCPSCSHKLTEKEGEPLKFCSYCGQKL